MKTLTIDQAKGLEAAFLDGLDRAQDAYEQIMETGAWTQLGHDSYADWWRERVVPVMRALSMKPTREIAAAGIEQVRREDAERPPAQRHTKTELGEMFGIHRDTVAGRKTQDREKAELPHGTDLGPATDSLPADAAEPTFAPDRPTTSPLLQGVRQAALLTRQPARPTPVMLTLRTHAGDEVAYPQPQAKATFNQTDGDGISWAAWSWNPVTGCLHGCDYCYARAIANRFPDGFPAGFTPLFHHERLGAPANTVIPERYHDDEHPDCGLGDCKICAYRRVFVCSMADLYGRWVPDEWIQQVHASMLASPQWQYLLLTKFPARYVGLNMPSGAWLGTSVDEQKRVRIAEDAFRQVRGVKVKWLSLEPLREPLEFADLSMFDWVVIGAQTETRQPDGTVAAFDPPAEWVIRITAQAKEAGCRVHWKPNLRRSLWFNEYPGDNR